MNDDTNTAADTHRIEVTIPDRVIIHLYTLMLIAKGAKAHEADVSIAVGKKRVDGKSVMGLLDLLGPGHRQVTIEADGDDAENALESMKRLIEEGLFED